MSLLPSSKGWFPLFSNMWTTLGFLQIISLAFVCVRIARSTETNATTPPIDVQHNVACHWQVSTHNVTTKSISCQVLTRTSFKTLHTFFCKTLHTFVDLPHLLVQPRPPRCTGRTARCANTISPSMLAAGAAPVRAWNTEKVGCSKSEEKVFKEWGKGFQRKRKRFSNHWRCSNNS